jgi:AhpD family alkylhydroperoxidase
MAAFDRSIELDPVLRGLVKARALQLNGCVYCI